MVRNGCRHIIPLCKCEIFYTARIFIKFHNILLWYIGDSICIFEDTIMMEIGWQDIRDLGYRNWDEYLHWIEEEEDGQEMST